MSDKDLRVKDLPTGHVELRGIYKGLAAYCVVLGKDEYSIREGLCYFRPVHRDSAAHSYQKDKMHAPIKCWAEYKNCQWKLYPSKKSKVAIMGASNTSVWRVKTGHERLKKKTLKKLLENKLDSDTLKTVLSFI